MQSAFQSALTSQRGNSLLGTWIASRFVRSFCRTVDQPAMHSQVDLLADVVEGYEAFE